MDLCSTCPQHSERLLRCRIRGSTHTAAQSGRRLRQRPSLPRLLRSPPPQPRRPRRSHHLQPNEHRALTSFSLHVITLAFVLPLVSCSSSSSRESTSSSGCDRGTAGICHRDGDALRSRVESSDLDHRSSSSSSSSSSSTGSYRNITSSRKFLQSLPSPSTISSPSPSSSSPSRSSPPHTTTAAAAAGSVSPAAAALPDWLARILRPRKKAPPVHPLTKLRLGVPCAAGSMCCSSRPQPPSGVASMTSEWMSNAMPHGAKIQIRCVTFNSWWGPDRLGKWTSVISCSSKEKPAAGRYFLVERGAGLGANQLRLVTLSNTYVRAGGPRAEWGSKHGVVDTTSNRSDPATVFTVVRKENNIVNLWAFDGLVVSSPGDGGLYRWGSVGAEWERFEVREVARVPSIRGVNLGAWLVIENWMLPGFYDDASKWKDGTGFRLQTLSSLKWVNTITLKDTQISCAESNRSSNYYTDFRVITTAMPGTFRVVTQGLEYWRLAADGTIVANSQEANKEGLSDFVFIPKDSSYSRVLIRAANGKLLRPSSASPFLLLADLDPSLLPEASKWQSAAAFVLEMFDLTNGEWQFSYSQGGPSGASPFYSSFRSSFLSESDFQFLASQQINAVRIPIGYWIMEAPLPDFPFPSGALAALDWAFQMGRKHGVRLWLSPHVVFGTNSGYLGGRSGLCEFGAGNNTMRTLGMIEFLVKRYVTNPAFLGLGLINEPLAPGNYGRATAISVELLSWYYQQAYGIVRKYSPCLFVGIEGRVGSSIWEVHWLFYGTGATNVLLEQHMYNVFYGWEGMTPEQEAEQTLTSRMAEIKGLQKYGFQVLVGEWCLAMRHPNAALTAKFGLNQLKAFGTAKAGWFFWSYKHNIQGWDHWHFRRATANGWLKKKADGNWW